MYEFRCLREGHLKANSSGDDTPRPPTDDEYLALVEQYGA